jgi:hypothetical protein
VPRDRVAEDSHQYSRGAGPTPYLLSVLVTADHPELLYRDELSRNRALVHVPEAAALVLRVVGQDDVFAEQGGRELFAAMCELYDEVDGAAPARVCFRYKVQVLATVSITSSRAKLKNAPLAKPP